MARIVATTYKQLLDARNTSFKLARVLQALSDGTLTHGSTMSAQSAAHVDALILQHSSSMNVAGLFADKAATLGLNFWSNTYFTRSSSFGVMQGANFEDLVTLTRATAGGFINELGVYALAPADTPRLSHDPSSVVLSTSIVDLSTEVPTFALEAHTFIAGDQFRATANVGYICGVVLSATTTSVTVQAQNVVGVGVGSSWVCIKPLGLLVEEQRTNLLLRSEDFSDTYWAKSGVTVTANAILSPSGLVAADKLVEDAGVSIHAAFRVYGAAVVDRYTYSVYVKAAGRDTCFIRFGMDSSGFGAKFNLLSGTISEIDATIEAAIVNAGNGWFRCTISRAATTTAPLTVYSYVRQGGSYTGDGVSGVYIWGTQLEVGSSPSSYIPTTTAQVTRAADVATVNTLSPWYNASEGTLVVVASRSSTASWSAAASLAVGETTASELYIVPGNPGSGTAHVELSISGVTNGANVGPVLNGAPARMALSYRAGAASFSAGGLPPVGIPAPSIPAFTRLRIGTRAGGSLPLNGIIRSITYYPSVIDVQQASA